VTVPVEALTVAQGLSETDKPAYGVLGVFSLPFRLQFAAVQQFDPQLSLRQLALQVDKLLAVVVGAAADQAVRSGIFEDYQARRAANTLRHQLGDLAAFAEYLAAVKFYPSTTHVDERKARGAALFHEATAWSSITYGLVAGFVRWQLQQGYAVRSVNVRLSTIKRFAQLAFTAGAIDADQLALIRTVTTKTYSQQINIDKGRTVTRIGDKKADPVLLTASQVATLRKQPPTPQGVRDALMLTMMLDLGLRVGELAALKVGDVLIDDNAGTMYIDFYRAKVKKQQKLEINTPTLKRVVRAWFNGGYAPTDPAAPLLRASAKSKDGDKLGAPGMSERAITGRVEYLGRKLGIVGLSVHDLSHSWADRFANQHPDQIFRLQEWGGWNSLTMPRWYVERAKVANQGYSLEAEESVTPPAERLQL
jgi:integrase